MLYTMILRNTKLFFKDKGMFFTALITPLVLLVLYVTFLGSVYADSFRSSIPEGIAVSDTIVNSMVAGELLSSLLAVCCITVAFCANMRMVQDKITGAQKDIAISPAKSHLISISYFISSALVTWIICFIALLAGLIYVHAVGYDMALSDVAWMVLDIVLWNIPLLHLQRLPLHAGTGFRSGNHCQRWVRLRMRCLHADFQLRRHPPKSPAVSSRHLRHLSHSKPRPARCL